jgi:hypothetical protein
MRVLHYAISILFARFQEAIGENASVNNGIDQHDDRDNGRGHPVVRGYGVGVMQLLLDCQLHDFVGSLRKKEFHMTMMMITSITFDADL